MLPQTKKRRAPLRVPYNVNNIVYNYVDNFIRG
jgi:hypothetical protein